MKSKIIFGICVVLSGAFLLSKSASSRELDIVGLQLWSVRQAMQDDFKGTLIQVAKAGYDQVEFVGYYNHDPKEIRALLDSLGLTAPAAHTGYDLLSGENLQKTIDAAKMLGHEYLVMPSLPQIQQSQPQPRGEERRRGPRPYSLEDVKKIAGIFNEVGQACRDAGLRFAYHNHRHEFVEIDSTGMLMYDILLQETDPSLVDFEMDLGWAVAADADPLAYFEKYPNRFKLFHVKDMDDENHSVVVGKGKIDFASIFAKSESAGVTYYIVEYEGNEDPLSSVAQCVDYLKKMAF